jgi:hypothetical protein
MLHASVRYWHRAEGLGGATIATEIQEYNRHAERVPVMPALDPTSDQVAGLQIAVTNAPQPLK